MAYCLDEAVAYFGGEVEAQLNSVEGKTSVEISTKRDRMLKSILGEPVPFADPMAVITT